MRTALGGLPALCLYMTRSDHMGGDFACLIQPSHAAGWGHHFFIPQASCRRCSITLLEASSHQPPRVKLPFNMSQHYHFIIWLDMLGWLWVNSWIVPAFKEEVLAHSICIGELAGLCAHEVLQVVLSLLPRIKGVILYFSIWKFLSIFQNILCWNLNGLLHIEHIPRPRLLLLAVIFLQYLFLPFLLLLMHKQDVIDFLVHGNLHPLIL